jgi:glyoxylase-like metal-dependent hydrolase (beta-lactamase superfamily II)
VSTYTIEPIRTGSFAEAETSFLYYLAHDDQYGVKTLAIYWVFLIRGSDALILVDTGPADPDPATVAVHHDFQRSPDESLLTALAARGIRPTDIDVVVNTHLHWDHCSGNDQFPKAEILIQESEIIEALDPVPAHQTLYTPARLDPAWIRAIPQTKPVRGDAEPAPGITLVHLPSHTVGSQAVLVETVKGPILIAGDITPYFDNWSGRWGHKHVPSGAFQSSLRQYYDAFERIEAIAPIIVLPGNDPRVADHPTYG